MTIRESEVQLDNRSGGFWQMRTRRALDASDDTIGREPAVEPACATLAAVRISVDGSRIWHPGLPKAHHIRI